MLEPWVFIGDEKPAMARLADIAEAPQPRLGARWETDRKVAAV